MDVRDRQGEVVGGLFPATDRWVLGRHYFHRHGQCTDACAGTQLFRLREPAHRYPLTESPSPAETSVASSLHMALTLRLGHENAVSALGDTAWMLDWFLADCSPKTARPKPKARMKAALPPRKYLNRLRAEQANQRTTIPGTEAGTSTGVTAADDIGPTGVVPAGPAADEVGPAAGVDPAAAGHEEPCSKRAGRWAAASGAELAALIAEVEFSSLDDDESIEYLKAATRLASWAESRRIGAMARFSEHRPNMRDEPGNYEVFSRFAASEIGAALSISPGSARHQLGQACFIHTNLPGTYTALAEGRIGLPHARMILLNCPPADAEATARYENELLDLAAGLSPAQLDKQAMRVSNDIHPISLEVRHQSARGRRNINFMPQPDAMTEIYAYLPAVEAAAIEDRIEHTARTLQGPTEHRNLAQLKADVLTDLLLGEHAGTGPRPKADVLITIPALTLMGHSDEPGDLEGYGPVPAQTARRLAGESSSWYRILTDPFNGSILAYGRKHKKPPADLKRLLRARDGHCRFPGCNRRPTGCDIDHTTAREHGGLTNHDNLCHLCPAHHKAKHDGGWDLEQLHGGIMRWTAPTGHTYTTKPEHTSKPAEPIKTADEPPPF